MSSIPRRDVDPPLACSSEPRPASRPARLDRRGPAGARPDLLGAVVELLIERDPALRPFVDDFEPAMRDWYCDHGRVSSRELAEAALFVMSELLGAGPTATGTCDFEVSVRVACGHEASEHVGGYCVGCAIEGTRDHAHRFVAGGPQPFGDQPVFRGVGARFHALEDCLVDSAPGQAAPSSIEVRTPQPVTLDEALALGDAPCTDCVGGWYEGASRDLRRRLGLAATARSAASPGLR